MRYVNGAKFWEIERTGAALVIRWGEGRKSQERRKTYASDAAAIAEHDQMVASRLALGFRPEEADPKPPLVPETADELLVYADWLLQQGDAFGEYLIALKEHPDLAERLLDEHRLEWLGPERREIRFGWRDGLVRSVEIDNMEHAASILSHLVRRPMLRFLESLTSPTVPAATLLAAIVAHAPRPWTLRELSAPWGGGDWANARGLWAVVPRLQRVELRGAAELGTIDLPELREATLGVSPYNVGSFVAPVVPRLERLTLAGSALNEPKVVAGLAPLLKGGNLPALRHLALEHGGTDALLGHLLAGALPERLESLTLIETAITSAGVRELVAARRRFRALRHLQLYYNRTDEWALQALRTAFPFALAEGPDVYAGDDEDDDDRYDDIRE